MDEESKWWIKMTGRGGSLWVGGWGERMMEAYNLMKQAREPGARGECLKDPEEEEMYSLYKEDPEEMEEEEEEEEERAGKPLDDSVEILLNNFSEFFHSHDGEFHVASLAYKPDFKVMPEGWDGTTRDPDEVLYEISMKEDQRLYEEFVLCLNFNKKKVAGEVKCHKYSRRRTKRRMELHS
ncbi:uncharacterized protein A4U43_C01F33540 [Asparagus officinalis]|uniref:Uncharacterized protein n=1 Tax=Asparagus officinalis TaxID=4686 RepID=A0A5P1FVP4_ASPOF|nr:uncharacterized protein A4U43_C01F33540 [Asparagus officinalis]